jgi:hypothetical protein
LAIRHGCRGRYFLGFGFGFSFGFRFRHRASSSRRSDFL